jgi:hypothetical protein
LTFFLALLFLLGVAAFLLEAGAELDAFEEGAFDAKPFRPRDARSFWLSAMIFCRSSSLHDIIVCP